MQKHLLKQFRQKFSTYKEQVDLANIYKLHKEKLVKVRKTLAGQSNQNLVLNDAFNGMKDKNCLLHENSYVDSKLGVTFRGFSLQEIKEFLPRGQTSQGETQEPLPEALFHLFLTGSMPNQIQLNHLQSEMVNRQSVNLQEVNDFLATLPKEMHVITKLSSVVMYLQKNSEFSRAYADGINKNKYWEVVLEDSLNLMSQMPVLAALVYNHSFNHGHKAIPSSDLDMTANFMQMIGRDSEGVDVDALRAFLTVMSDYGGSLNQHTMSLVGSALSDTYLSFSAALNGLQGTYHKLVDHEFSSFLLLLKNQYGNNPTDEQILSFVDLYVEQSRSVPGFGHEYIQYTDPRLLHLKQFSDKNFQDSAELYLVKRILRVVPMHLERVLKTKQKASVFAYSGVYLREIGFQDYQSHYLLCALSKSIGCTTQIVNERALGLAIERPGSVDSNYILQKFKQ